MQLSDACSDIYFIVHVARASYRNAAVLGLNFATLVFAKCWRYYMVHS